MPLVPLTVEQQLVRLCDQGDPRLLLGGQVGLEKESLRVARTGGLSQTPHPAGLGSPLTHPWITTDYSEALLELVTPPFPTLGRRWISCAICILTCTGNWMTKSSGVPACPVCWREVTTSR